MILFVPTIQHTGTWFTITILFNGGQRYQIVEYHPGETMLRDYQLRSQTSIVTAHFPLSSDVSDADRNKFLTWENIVEVFDELNAYPGGDGCMVIVPVRDVLASLISRERRIPNQGHKYIIDGFLLLAQRFHIFKDRLILFPVDLSNSIHERAAQMVALECRVGPNQTRDMIIATWPRINSPPGRTPLQNAYSAKDSEPIKQAIPNEWNYLMEKRDILQPFFVGLGYRDLLWFQ